MEVKAVVAALADIEGGVAPGALVVLYMALRSLPRVSLLSMAERASWLPSASSTSSSLVIMFAAASTVRVWVATMPRQAGRPCSRVGQALERRRAALHSHVHRKQLWVPNPR